MSVPHPAPFFDRWMQIVSDEMFGDMGRVSRVLKALQGVRPHMTELQQIRFDDAKQEFDAATELEEPDNAPATPIAAAPSPKDTPKAARDGLARVHAPHRPNRPCDTLVSVRNVQDEQKHMPVQSLIVQHFKTEQQVMYVKAPKPAKFGFQYAPAVLVYCGAC